MARRAVRRAEAARLRSSRARAPQSIDPSLDFTTQGGELHWLSYLGPYTYAHASGLAGTKVIPAVATALPKVTDGGKTYTFTIRKGLKYSNGAPLKASDLKFAVQRALKLGWSAASFLTSTIAGAADYSKGKAKTVSGITADDGTGTTVFHLIKPYGAFLNVLAEPGVSYMPQTTPVKDQSASPPPGFGPYEIKNVSPNVSFDLDKNPSYASQAIPGIPVGHVNVHVKIESNTTTEASDVLNGTADIFDWGDTIPPALIQKVSQQTSPIQGPADGQDVLLLPQHAGEAVQQRAGPRRRSAWRSTGPALAKLGSGALVPGCFLLPPGMPGHPTGQCPYGNPNASPNVAAAKKLVQQSGMSGQPVTVWGQNRQPRLEWAENLVATLNSIGFKATLKTIADQQYFSQIETLKNHPQAGFADWQQDFPNPADFYQNLVDANAILPVGNSNYEELNDPHVQAELKALYPVQTSQLSSVASRWAALDEYLAKNAYVVMYGYLAAPEFMSTRINFGGIVFNPLEGNDFSSVTIK